MALGGAIHLLPYQKFSELFPQAMLCMGPKIYSEFNITAQQFQALKEIGKEPINVGDLSSKLGMKQSAAARLLRRLEEKNWIARRQDTNDRRVYWLRLTSEGKTYMDKLHLKRENVINEMFNKLSIEEQQKIVEGIELLLKSLK